MVSPMPNHLTVLEDYVILLLQRLEQELSVFVEVRSLSELGSYHGEGRLELSLFLGFC